MAELSIVADQKKNQVMLRMAGTATHDEGLEFIDKITDEMDQLKPGFTLFNDARGLEAGDENMNMLVAKAVKIIIQKRPSKIARVVDASPGGHKLGEISINAGYLAATFDSPEDALRFLNG